MADLYTNLRALKMAMNGGVMPPMTPLPPNTPDWIDPAFVPGLGALSETEADGLRCPVRGCGMWRHRLERHLNYTHSDIGGARAIRRHLSVPPSAKLISVRAAAWYAEHGRRVLASRGLSGDNANNSQPRLSDVARARARQTKKLDAGTVGILNLRNACETQTKHRIIDLHHRLGRAPSYSEYEREYGSALMGSLKQVFGTWRNALGQCGLEAVRRKWGREPVLAGLSAYLDAHGRFPRAREVQRGVTRPLLPCYAAVLRAFGAVTWREAMRRAASQLNIYGGPYGLPERVRPREAAAA